MSEPARLSTLRVLLVEDDHSVAKLLRMILRDLEVEVTHIAQDGIEALRFLGENESQVNTVISDWNMPKMTGIDLLRQIRTVNSTLQFMMITGNAIAEAVLEARALNVNAFIAKPFEPEQIRDKLQGLAEQIGRLQQPC